MIYAKVGIVVAAILFGWWLGTNHVEGKWAKADNEALRMQKELTADAIRERDRAQQVVDAALFRLAASQSKRAELVEKLKKEINREPIVLERTIEVPGDCPAVVTPVIDVARHFRLWNDAITGQLSEADITAGTTDSGDAAVRPPGDTTGGVDDP